MNSTYEETVAWMFEQLPMYQQQGVSAYKPDLTNVLLLAEHLGNPHLDVKFVHIAGTNGKGSTSHMLASVLQEAGFRTGLFTSPHLKDFRERIRIDGEMISKDYVIEFIAKNKDFFERHHLSFFEMSAGLAFQYFKEHQVDIAVIETGLGGRLDATNIITPVVSVITNIGLDHTNLLGNTLELIAAEKAGIIKSGVPVVVGEYTSETKSVFLSKAQACNSALLFASDEKAALPEVEFDLKGDYQEQNRRTVMATIGVLRKDGFDIHDSAIERGLTRVASNTGLLGRWQKLSDKPLVICDTAHNSHGLSVVIRQVLSQTFSKLHVVFGVVNDKELDEVLPLLPVNAEYYFAKPDILRGLDAHLLMAAARHYGISGDAYPSVSDAYKAAHAKANAEDLIFVGGSTFVVAEIL